jgi:hypothetical protein
MSAISIALIAFAVVAVALFGAAVLVTEMVTCTERGEGFSC